MSFTNMNGVVHNYQSKNSMMICAVHCRKVIADA